LPTPLPHADFPAVLDIEDMRFVSICGLRRPRPPIVPFLCSLRRHLEVGKTYRYCTCGRSEEQPWCDDSHLSTDPQPIEFQIKTPQTWHAICGCKYSLIQPFCDGSVASTATRHRGGSAVALCEPGLTCHFLCLCDASSHIHAVDGYEEVPAAAPPPVAVAVAPAAPAPSQSSSSPSSSSLPPPQSSS
jgi:CDGSH-type Zn-finger protein